MHAQPVSTTVCPECQTTSSGPYCVNCGKTLGDFISAESWEEQGTETRPVGTVVGAYRLLELLGSGGMGHVYRAEHEKLGRKVAIKTLRREYASNRIAVSRFFAEARAVNRISHDNIVEITDFLENPGGDNCIIMELLRGEDLGARIERERRLPVEIAISIGAQVASALAAVHAAGMVHRDLKPDNIFLIERAGMNHFVKLLDFGVAKLSDHAAAGRTHTTAVGQIIGTPQYMSPEQASGAEIDHRTDIYALGIVLYEMVTGVQPFAGGNFGDVLVRHLTHTPRAPGLLADVPPALDALIQEMLAKDAQHRPPNLGVVERRLRAMLEDTGRIVLARAATDHSHGVYVRPRLRIVRRWPLIASAVAALAIGSVAAYRGVDVVPAHAAPPPVSIEVPAVRASSVVTESVPPAIAAPVVSAPPPQPSVTAGKRVKPAKAVKKVTAKRQVIDRNGTIDVFAD